MNYDYWGLYLVAMLSNDPPIIVFIQSNESQSKTLITMAPKQCEKTQALQPADLFLLQQLSVRIFNFHIVQA